MKDIAAKYKRQFSDKKFALSVLVGAALLLGAYVVNYYTSIYADNHVGNTVTDIILTDLPVYDVDALFIYGPMVLWAFIAVLCLKEPKRIPFVLKSVALFVVIRALFTTLTHLGPYPYEVPADYTDGLMRSLTFGSDLFFSGHTGLPFLIALIFGKLNKNYYFLFVPISIFFGIIVLMGHYHYTIDVAAAFFITYTIFHIALKWFKKDSASFYAIPDHETIVLDK